MKSFLIDVGVLLAILLAACFAAYNVLLAAIADGPWTTGDWLYFIASFTLSAVVIVAGLRYFVRGIRRK